MEHVAIDLGGRKSQLCVRASTGEIVEERAIATDAIESYLRERVTCRVVVEACTESFRVADAARAAGHDIRVVSTTLVRALGVGARRTKTDERDARALSEASVRMELPSVHVASESARDRRSFLSMRDGLVQARTQLINTVKSWMRKSGVRCKPGASEHFPTRLKTARSELAPAVKRQLEMIDALSESIAEADDELATMVKADETCPRLMTVPGVGPVTAMRFVSTIDDVSRFRSAHDVESYLGLVPGEHSSGEKKRRTSITKAGNAQMRAVLVQAAWSIRRVRKNDPMVLWSIEVEKRRGKLVAAIALARKIAGVMFALWRDGTEYDASHVKKQRAETTARNAL